MNIVSWHPVLTDHQSFTLQALEHAIDGKVTVVVARNEDLTRKAQGWTPAEVGSLTVLPLGPRPLLRDIRHVLREHRHCVHLFGSPFDQPSFMVALWCGLRMGLPIYLISEPYSTIASGYLDDRRRMVSWLKAKLRPTLYRLYGLVLRRRVQGVFTISPLALSQYRAMGIPDKKLHPFGYFVPRQTTAPAARFPRKGCKAVFVGNLIGTKGVRELAATTKRLMADGIDLQVDVYGAGDPSPFEFDEISIRYAGRIPFGEAQSVIAGYDFLVLPSRYDGWGVVVNEAVLAGVPVLCSDAVGAAGFIRKWGCGMIYSAGSANALEASMRALAVDSELLDRLSQACIVSREHLLPTVAGRYMADVLTSDGRPGVLITNPWYDV
jgi:glycosyltransferase involved in cell wall biosynthesis